MKRTQESRSQAKRESYSDHDTSIRRSREREAAKAEAIAELEAEMDEIISEIDDLLVENAEQFVSRFIQQNGQ